MASHKQICGFTLVAICLAVILPIHVSGHRSMWTVSISTIVVVATVGAIVAGKANLCTWFGHRH
jgi:hypothetical protein